MTEKTLKQILIDVSVQVRSLLSERLITAILYGSYARGDFDEESDMDIALLVNCAREEVSAYYDGLAGIATDISMQYGMLVSFVCIPYADYIKRLPALPFYQNIEREGVKLSA